MKFSPGALENVRRTKPAAGSRASTRKTRLFPACRKALPRIRHGVVQSRQIKEFNSSRGSYVGSNAGSRAAKSEAASWAATEAASSAENLAEAPGRRYRTLAGVLGARRLLRFSTRPRSPRLSFPATQRLVFRCPLQGVALDLVWLISARPFHFCNQRSSRGREGEAAADAAASSASAMMK